MWTIRRLRTTKRVIFETLMSPNWNESLREESSDLQRLLFIRRSIWIATLLLLVGAMWPRITGAQQPRQILPAPQYPDTMSGPFERAEVRPVWTSHSCLTPLQPYGTDELSPDDMSRPVEKGSWFRDLPLIRIEVDVPPGICEGQCTRRVSTAVADSLSLWRDACGRCSYDFLVAVVASSDLFLDERIYSALLNARNDVLSAIALADSQLSGIASFNSLGGHVIVPYYRIAYTDRILEGLCLADPKEFSVTWAIKLWSSICPKSAPPETSEPKLSLSFVKGDTACGSAALFLACGDPSKQVELTLWKTRYEIAQSPTREYGKSPRSLLLGDPAGMPVNLYAVLLHEIGHFLGLGHLQEKNRLPSSLKAAMQSTFDNAMCVSIADIMMLTSAADARWAYRAASCSGLRRPASP